MAYQKSIINIGNKADNRVSELEWNTHSENMEHAHSTGLIDHYKRPIICIETGVEYPSIKEASIATNTSSSHICNCCKGRKKTTGGYHWRYKD